MEERKNNLSLSVAHERGRHGTEICQRGVRHELGGADGSLQAARG